MFAAGMFFVGILFMLHEEPDYPAGNFNSVLKTTDTPKMESQAEQMQDMFTDTLNSEQGEAENLAPGGSILLEEKEDDSPVTMTFAGDLLLQDGFYEVLKQEGVTGIMDEAVIHQLTGVDLTFLNQEFPIGVTGEPADKTYTFRVKPDVTKYMLDMGIDVVTLGNNHSLDYGRSALEETFVALENAGIGYVGAGRNLEDAKAAYDVEIKGKKIALLGASRVIPYVSWNASQEQSGLFTTYDPVALIEEIKKAQERNDFVIVYVHWGVEKSTHPEEYQRTLAKQYIDAGADLVLGSHPHVLQGFEYYNGVPIVYSMGNFIFNTYTADSMMIEAVLNDNQTCSLRVIPCGMSGRKMMAKNEEESRKVFEYLTSISYNVQVDENGCVVSLDYPNE